MCASQSSSILKERILWMRRYKEKNEKEKSKFRKKVEEKKKEKRKREKKKEVELAVVGFRDAVKGVY